MHVVTLILTIIVITIFRLENGWYVRDIPSPVQSGTGASSTVPSSPPSETEFENIQLSSNNYLESPNVQEPVPSSKQNRKVNYHIVYYCTMLVFIKFIPVMMMMYAKVTPRRLF